MDSSTRDVTRRGFLKGTGAFAAAASLLGVASIAAPQQVFADTGERMNAADEGTVGEVFGHCRMCMLCGSCSFTATTKDGVVVNIEGDPDRKTNAGTLCPRGKGAIMNLYNPYRIKAPMKRTNPEKGMDVDPGWVEISWDEAISIAAEKVGGCLATDPRTLLHLYSFAAYESSHATLGQGTWAHMLGANVSQVKGQMCAIHYGGMYTMCAVPTVNYDGRYSEYVVVMGKSLGYDNGYAGGDARTFASNVHNGRKYVVVGPRATMEASRGEWVSCKINTELALVYAWLHEMLYEFDKGFDEPFVKSRTNCPYLIGPDGEYVRNSDDKPLIWDAADSTAKPMDDETLTDPALTGSYTVNGVACRPSFELIKEALVDFTPEWAEGITTVPADKIREIASELVSHARFGATIEIDGETLPFRPACLVIGRGCTNQQTGTLIDIWSRVLNMFLGNVGLPGGVLGTTYTSYYENADNTVEPMGEAVTCTQTPTWPPNSLDYADYFPHKHSTQTFLWRTLQDPEKYGITYKPSVMFVSAANPVVGSDDADLVIDGIKKFDYVIYQACYHMDEMAMMSDLLLPEHANLEQHTCHLFPGNECSGTSPDGDDFVKANHVVVVRKGVKPLYNTKDGNDQLMEMFYKMGMGPVWNGLVDSLGSIGFVVFNSIGMWPKCGVAFDNPEVMLDPNKEYTAEEMFDINLKSAFGPDKGLDYLDEKKTLVYSTPKNGADLYATHRQQTIRFQAYLMSQKHSGDVLVPGLRALPVDIGDLIKIPLDELERRYQPVPYYPDNLVIDNEPPEYTLRAFTYRQPLFMFRLGSMDQDPLRRDYAEKYVNDSNAVLIHPDTAAENGIAQGDRVKIESPYGHTFARAQLTQTVRPDSVGIGGMRGRKTAQMGVDLLEDTNYNDLLCGDFGHIDPLDGAEMIAVNVKVTKA